MKKGLFVLVAAAAFIFTSCKEDVTISFSNDNIIVPVGSNESDVLKYASASDGSTVTMSGVDFTQIGEQTGTFKAGEASATKTVKVSAEPLAGRYKIHVLSSEGQELTSGDGWIVNATEGSAFNQVELGMVVGDYQIFEGKTSLTLTFNNGKGSIDSFEGKLMFSSIDGNYTFSNVKYANVNGTYSLTGFDFVGIKQGYNDAEFSITLERK
ncbi:MAG: hypothetical protein J5792_04955 [Bacteroidales bacterium]|nr:hypothetical protein [Bacteroidales bacterium]